MQRHPHLAQHARPRAGPHLRRGGHDAHGRVVRRVEHGEGGQRLPPPLRRVGRARPDEPRAPLPQQPLGGDVVHRQRGPRPVERRAGSQALAPPAADLPPRGPHAPRDAGHGRPRRGGEQQHGRRDGCPGLQLPPPQIPRELRQAAPADDPRQRDRLDALVARRLQVPRRAALDAPLRRPSGIVVRRRALRLVEPPRGRLHPARRPSVVHGRIRLDRLRLLGRADALLLRLAEPLVALRHRRPRGAAERPLLALPQPLEPRRRRRSTSCPTGTGRDARAR